MKVTTRIEGTVGLADRLAAHVAALRLQEPRERETPFARRRTSVPRIVRRRRGAFNTGVWR